MQESNRIDDNAGSEFEKRYAYVYGKYKDAEDDSNPLSVIPMFYYWAL